MKEGYILSSDFFFQAIATRDAMAKCLYGALFDWIVLKVNQALLAKRHNSDHQVIRGGSRFFWVFHWLQYFMSLSRYLFLILIFFKIFNLGSNKNSTGMWLLLLSQHKFFIIK